MSNKISRCFKRIAALQNKGQEVCSSFGKAIEALSSQNRNSEMPSEINEKTMLMVAFSLNTISAII